MPTLREGMAPGNRGYPVPFEGSVFGHPSSDREQFAAQCSKETVGDFVVSEDDILTD